MVKKNKVIHNSDIKKLDIDSDAKNLLLELDEEIKQEKLLKKWRKYGPLLIAFCMLIIISVALWQYRLYKLEIDSKQDSDLYQKIEDIESKDPQNALKMLQENSFSTSGYNLLISFKKAQILTKQNKIKEAFDEYMKIYNQSSISRTYKELALISAGYLAVNNNKLLQSIKNDINEVSASDSEFKYSAKEIIAISQLNSDPKKAATYFKNIVNEKNAPQSMKDRSQTILREINSH